MKPIGGNMNKEVEEFINENNARYGRMFLNKANLNLEPYVSDSGEVKKDFYSDKEKGIITLIDKTGPGTHFCIENSELVTNEGEYRIGLFEDHHNDANSMYFCFFGLSSNIQIDIKKNEITIHYCYNDKIANSIFTYNRNNLMFKPFYGELVGYPDATLDQIMDMIKEVYNKILDTSDFKDRKLAEEKFEFMKPILREMISKEFIFAMKDRLANWKNETTGDTIEKLTGSLIEKEDCKFVGCNITGRELTYKNDEIIVEPDFLYTDIPGITIKFVGEEDLYCKNEVIYGEDHEENPYIMFAFCFSDHGSMKLKISDRKLIEFYTPESTWVSISRVENEYNNNDIIMNWFEKSIKLNENFGLFEYGIDNLIDRIYKKIYVDSPKFDRMFELIRPFMFQAILAIGERDLERLYLLEEKLINEIKVFDSALLEEKDDNKIDVLKSSKAKFIQSLAKTKGLIEDIKSKINEEKAKANTEKKK